MKKEIPTKTIHGFGSGHFRELEGKLLTIIETIGLKETQEDAVKSLVRNEIWKLWDKPSFSEIKEIEFMSVVLENSN